MKDIDRTIFFYSSYVFYSIIALKAAENKKETKYRF